MKRFLFINGLVALVAAATVGVVAGGAAHAAITCDAANPINGGTISDSVTAGPGCIIHGGAQVKGTVNVQPGGSLLLTNATVKGAVLATNPDYVEINGCSTTLCTGQGLGPVTIGDKVSITGATNTSNGSATYICDGALIKGSVDLQNNNSNGALFGTAVDLGSSVCDTPVTINGSVIVSNNAGLIRIGPAANGTGNSIAGSVSATNNTGYGTIINNVISGSLTASGNAPPYAVSGNTVRGACRVPGGTC